MAFFHLKEETIKALKRAFVDAQMPYDDDLRGLLLAKVNHQYTQTLNDLPNPGWQLDSDLDELNQLEKLNDESVPLKAWLGAALDAFQPRNQTRVFQSALDEIATGPAVSDTEVIVDALEALSNLIKRNQAAYDAVVIYGAAFKSTLDEIEVITDYKFLHEELHSLQLGWLGPEDLGTLEQISTNPGKRTRVKMLWANIKRCLAALRRIYAGGKVDRNENTWIDGLDQDQQTLNGAIDSNNIKGVEGGLEKVKRDVDIRLSELNTRLKKAIDTLKLKNLIETMSKVGEALKTLSTQKAIDPINKLEAAIKELSMLDLELSELIKQHDGWQRTDQRLILFGETISQNSDPQEVRTAVHEEIRLNTLRQILSAIKGAMLPLIEDRQSEWSGLMKMSTGEMERAFDAKNTDDAEKWFDLFCVQAKQYFYELDGEMKTRCEELKRIGEELRNVNGELGYR